LRAISIPKHDHTNPKTTANASMASIPNTPPWKLTPMIRAMTTTTSACKSARVPETIRLPNSIENRLMGARSSLSK